MTTPTDHMTIAEIIHDFATRQGDLTDRWAREDLAAILEQRMEVEIIAETKLLTKQRDNAEHRHERLESAVEALAGERTKVEGFYEHLRADAAIWPHELITLLAEQIRATETEGAS